VTVTPRLETPGRGLSEIFADEDSQTLRFTRQAHAGCVCETIESFGLPVSTVSAEQGALQLTFFSPDIETVRAIVEALKSSFGGVAIRRLTRAGEHASRDLVLLDRTPFTDRQLEVLETAHEMGYFSYPKGANAGEVAEALDICPSTFSEHLSAAQQKILDQLLASPSR
jgi:predicted DNA binding protein